MYLIKFQKYPPFQIDENMSDEQIETELANVEALTLQLRATADSAKVAEDDIEELATATDDAAIKAAYETSKQDEQFKNLFKGYFFKKFYIFLNFSKVFFCKKLLINFLLRLQSLHFTRVPAQTPCLCHSSTWRRSELGCASLPGRHFCHGR